MKSLYNILLLVSLYLLVVPTNSNFTYVENLSETTLPGSPPHISQIGTYEDGTILLRIYRINATEVNNTYCTEKKLFLRVIHLNGSVTEINVDLQLDPINYCPVMNKTDNSTINNNPIGIYPIGDQFILVCYTTPQDYSNPYSYQEWGGIIDWSGSLKSRMNFGPSYVSSDNNWDPQSSITQNINTNQGFLRAFAIRQSDNNQSQEYGYQQYLVDDYGNMTLLVNGSIPVPLQTSSSSLTTMSTIDGGYAIIYANSSNYDPSDPLLTTRGGIYATFIPYNQSISVMYLLYRTSLNVTFGQIYCGLMSVGVGHVCTCPASSTNIVTSTNGTTLTNITTNYLQVYFLSTGSVLNSSLITEIQSLPGAQAASWAVESMVYGGFILEYPDTNGTYVTVYDNNDAFYPLTNLPIPIPTDEFYARGIMNNNNTYVLSQPPTPHSYANWSLFTYQLPNFLKGLDHGYGSVVVNNTLPPLNATISSTPSNISITFYDPVILSSGNVTIYQYSETGNNFRLRISAMMDEYCDISQDGLTVTLKIFGSTFNLYNTTYFVKMDNNFVKIEAAFGTLCLVPDATEKFNSLSSLEKSEYIDGLLTQLSDALPVRRARLTSNKRFQFINSSDQIIVALRINMTINNEEITVPGVVSNLNDMIINKKITTISLGNYTRDLDPAYGFRLQYNLWEQDKNLIIAIIAPYVFYMAVAALTYYLDKLIDVTKLEETAKEIKNKVVKWWMVNIKGKEEGVNLIKNHKGDIIKKKDEIEKFIDGLIKDNSNLISFTMIFSVIDKDAMSIVKEITDSTLDAKIKTLNEFMAQARKDVEAATNKMIDNEEKVESNEISVESKEEGAESSEEDAESNGETVTTDLETVIIDEENANLDKRSAEANKEKVESDEEKRSNEIRKKMTEIKDYLENSTSKATMIAGLSIESLIELPKYFGTKNDKESNLGDEESRSLVTYVQ
ncbi:184_t:CDS:2 [Acaulospora colombiana]|uniref:184_t:CDS:1 n=1 Tax=Acaulospora colombiana TaxID=27376 RepID=A0ACA9M8F0_9GLOM|nr:184_t:CDS:2 [Acaulospora colombiana]